jgi:dTDP-6-deoxy-L-talose 4-dehydrogenase [NAD(P)+]
VVDTPGSASRRLAAARPKLKVVVLGGTGFLGRHICSGFVSAGYDVLSVARRPTGIPGARFLPLDLFAASPSALAAMLTAERAAVVVNATGGVWGVTASQMKRLNVGLVEHLVGAVAAMPWRPRVVHLGSVHEYGMVAVGQAINERTRADPVSPYGMTKLRGTQVVLTATESGRIDGVVLRVANVVGAGAPPDSLLGRVATQLSDAARAGERAVFRLSPLRAKRDFVDARDISDAVTAAAGAPVSGAVINVGRGEAVSVRLLVDKLIATSGVRADVVEEEPEERELIRGGDVDWQLADIRAARELLDWAPTRTLDESLQALWAEVCG